MWGKFGIILYIQACKINGCLVIPARNLALMKKKKLIKRNGGHGWFNLRKVEYSQGKLATLWNHFEEIKRLVTAFLGDGCQKNDLKTNGHQGSYCSAMIKVTFHHGRGIHPPVFGKGGMINAFIPPWKWLKLQHNISELPYRSAWKSSITTMFCESVPSPLPGVQTLNFKMILDKAREKSANDGQSRLSSPLISKEIDAPACFIEPK